MRRWLLIVLLIVYPFQVALAVADRCCVTTPLGVTHHSVAQVAGASAAEPVFVADEVPALADPHCAACSFGHSLYLPSAAVDVRPARHRSPRIAFVPPSLTAPPAGRLERPKWSAAAR